MGGGGGPGRQTAVAAGAGQDDPAVRDRETGDICLADEVLTSDSSRYWDAREYSAGNRGLSFDKQIVRDWLSANWDKHGAPPTLPGHIVTKTAARYTHLIERLTG
jgi:phosphoribosylaminoimidazole-succinocarboxamide synthase